MRTPEINHAVQREEGVPYFYGASPIRDKSSPVSFEIHFLSFGVD
jgi:hypothetical protein